MTENFRLFAGLTSFCVRLYAVHFSESGPGGTFASSFMTTPCLKYRGKVAKIASFCVIPLPDPIGRNRPSANELGRSPRIQSRQFGRSRVGPHRIGYTGGANPAHTPRTIAQLPK